MNIFRKITWPLMIVISLSMSLIFISGFTRVASITNGSSHKSSNEIKTTTQVGDDASNKKSLTVASKTSANTQESGQGSEPINEKLLLIIGDSIGAGVGDERNLGIGGRFLSELDFELADTFEVVNQSAAGAVTDEMLHGLKVGDYDKALEKASYIIVSIGGNNLNRMRRTDSSLKAVEFEERLAEHLEALEASLQYMRDKNKSADIVLLGLYNPYGQSSALEDIRILYEWNHQSRLKLLNYTGVHYIPLYDVFKEKLDAYLSIDEFHPSGTGYQRIAELLKEVLGL